MVVDLFDELNDRLADARSAVQYAATRVEKVAGTVEYLRDELEAPDDGRTFAPPDEPLPGF